MKQTEDKENLYYGCIKPTDDKEHNLDELIEDYKRTCSEEAYNRERAKKAFDPSKRKYDFMLDDLNEILTMKDEKTLPEITKRCICNRNRHQRRILPKAVNTATEAITAAEQLLPFSKATFANFEELYDAVKERIYNIDGINDSTLYDTCIRLGWSYTPKIVPDKYVYVHRDLRKSARAILGTKRLHLKEQGRPAIPYKEFIKANPKLQELPPLDLENFLCIYEKQIVTKQ